MSQSSGGQDEAPQGKQKIMYRKEYSILIDVLDNKKVKAESIINAACKICGNDRILACVPRSGNVYEITATDTQCVDVLEDGLFVNGVNYEAKKSIQDTFIVSIMHLPSYITDQEIEIKLRNCDAEILSPIKRRYVEIGGTKFADGTRFCKVRLPEYRKSLPFTLKFHDGESDHYYRLIHDGQCKTCSVCGSHKHLRKECPEFVCYRCGEQGHIKKNCTAERCDSCYYYKCTCNDENTDPTNDQATENEKMDDENVNDEDDKICEQCGYFECACEASDSEENKTESAEPENNESNMTNDETDPDENVIHDDENVEKDKDKSGTETVFGDVIQLSTEQRVSNNKENRTAVSKPVKTPSTCTQQSDSVKCDNSDKRKRAHNVTPTDNTAKIRVVEGKKSKSPNKGKKA